MIDEAELERLVVAAAEADEAAWQRLWAAIEPALLRIVAQPRFLGRLGQREDDRHNIVVGVMARLRADGFRRLGLYLEAKQDNSRLRFLTWVRVVAKRVGIDYLRGHSEYLRRDDSQASAPGRWVELLALPQSDAAAGERPPVTNNGTAHELLRYAAGVVPAEQLRALQMWVASESFETIAQALSLRGPGDAEKLVRAGIERLRRKYGEGPAS